MVYWRQDRKRYRGFSRRVTDLLVPSFPGNLPSIARNLFNAVFVVDLGSSQGLGCAHSLILLAHCHKPCTGFVALRRVVVFVSVSVSTRACFFAARCVHVHQRQFQHAVTMSSCVTEMLLLCNLSRRNIVLQCGFCIHPLSN